MGYSNLLDDAELAVSIKYACFKCDVQAMDEPAKWNCCLGYKGTRGGYMADLI